MSFIRKTCSVSRECVTHVCEFCPRQPYVELEVPKNVKAVLAVFFTLTSRDQGETLFFLV